VSNSGSFKSMIRNIAEWCNYNWFVIKFPSLVMGF
jgi:hypothetical protein